MDEKNRTAVPFVPSDSLYGAGSTRSSDAAGSGGRQDFGPGHGGSGPSCASNAAVPVAANEPVYELPGGERILENLRASRDGDRLTFNGGLIRNRLHLSTCSECGMGLVDDREYHPYFACQVFKRTHDSREVWRAMRKAARGVSS